MQEYQDQRRAMVSSSRGRGIPPATAGAVIALVLALLSPVAESGESTDIVWHAALEVATGEAHRGPWRMNESDFRYVDDASVALHEDGMAAVVWADQAPQEEHKLIKKSLKVRNRPGADLQGILI
ncbi:hypothetical protein MKP05_07190 [Halomonas sp. EGI 63088]|uniref:Uncharacterized protein n=1 Tax=Halomonas flagellata TaxID=2920385 RepID=A0ABS9RST2_9GAMM|nr:hypothetical protein [Halomonas flagellata]MCH4562913.1 hypothetical protein [Halomonas flagellata]